jgi:hypothetical protein
MIGGLIKLKQMDDNRFDDIIRDKLGEYEDPAYNSSAFAGLQNRMAGGVQSSWYGRYRNEILTAAAAVIIGVVLLWGQASLHQDNFNQISNELSKLQEQNAKLLANQEKLVGENASFRDKLADSTRLVEQRVAVERMYQDVSEQISLLQGKLQKANAATPQTVLANRQMVYMGKISDLPQDVIQAVSRDHELINMDGYVFMVVPQEELISTTYPYLNERKGITNRYLLPEYEFVIDSSLQTREDIVQIERNQVSLPVKQIRELEAKNYNRGIGIEVGPALEGYRAFYQPGKDLYAFGGGILANFITSPTLSIETGMLMHQTEYQVGEENVESLNIPAGDPTYGTLQTVEISSSMFELPLNLKYRHRISAANHLVLGAGISGLVYTKQEFEYIYGFEVGNNQIIPVETSFREKGTQWYLGTGNVALGLSSLLKNGKRLETMVFYKKGLTDLGLEQVEGDFMGVRAAYMFGVR